MQLNPFVRTVDDPDFGKLRFIRSFWIFGQGFWEGSLTPAFQSDPIWIQVVAGRKGPVEEQRKFFQRFQEEFPNMESKLLDIVIDLPLDHYHPRYFGDRFPELNRGQFRFEGMTVPYIDGESREWYLFYYHSTTGYSCSVTMEDFSPQYGELVYD